MVPRSPGRRSCRRVTEGGRSDGEGRDGFMGLLIIPRPRRRQARREAASAGLPDARPPRSTFQGGRFMLGSRSLLLAGFAFLPTSVGAARAETKVELKNVHLCCPACVKAVGEILKKIDGAQGECDAKAKTVSITAKDND